MASQLLALPSRSRLCLTLVLLLPVQLASGQTADTAQGQLRWKFQPGQVYNVLMTQNMKQDMQVAGQPVHSTNNTKMTMRWIVEDVDQDGVATISQTMDRVQMEMEAPMIGKVVVDTDDETDTPGTAAQMAGMFRPMIGAKIKQKMSSRGEILEVNIPDEVLKGFKSSPMGQAGMSADAIKDMTTKASPVLPPGQVEVGQTWSKQGTSRSPVGAISIDNSFTYEGTTVKDDRLLHKIGLKMKMDFEDGENKLGAKITVVDQDSNGTLYFDSDAGHLTGSELDQNMTMNVEVAGQKIVQKIEQTMKTTVTPAG